MSYHSAPAFMMQQQAPAQYTQYVVLEQPDGTRAVAPVMGSAQPVIYQHVPGSNGEMVLRQFIPQGPQFPKRTYSQTGKMEKFGENKSEGDVSPWTLNSFDKNDMEDEGDILYKSADKSDCYFWTRWLWCACMEPMHIVTTKYVESSKWLGCSKESDSKAMDIFDDADLSQTCFQHIWNTCGCCCVDHGTITLMGADRSSWRLEKIHDANETFDKIQKVLAKNRQERKKRSEGRGGGKRTADKKGSDGKGKKS